MKAVKEFKNEALNVKLTIYDNGDNETVSLHPSSESSLMRPAVFEWEEKMMESYKKEIGGLNRTEGRKITGYEIQNLRTLKDAVNDGNICLAVAKRLSDGKEKLLVCAVNQDDFDLVPFAEMIDGNPFDQYEPPIPSIETLKQIGKK